MARRGTGRHSVDKAGNLIRPPCTKNWNIAWHGGNAIFSISPTFHALTINRRLSGFFLMFAITWSIWLIERPSAVRQSHHCAP
jgi:hypothetical protein